MMIMEDWKKQAFQITLKEYLSLVTGISGSFDMAQKDPQFPTLICFILKHSKFKKAMDFIFCLIKNYKHIWFQIAYMFSHLRMRKYT